MINPTRGRHDGAHGWRLAHVTVDYDPFELAITHLTLATTGVATNEVAIERRPLTLNAVSSTDRCGMLSLAAVQ